MSHIPPQPLFNKTISINAPAQLVWQALTNVTLMKQWMFETPIDINTGWVVGGPINISGRLYKKPFTNKGTVLAFDPLKHLSYNHLSSLSRLPDVEENYTILNFSLVPQAGPTLLPVTITNFPTDTIYKHLAFYWNVTIEVLKRFIEGK